MCRPRSGRSFKVEERGVGIDITCGVGPPSSGREGGGREELLPLRQEKGRLREVMKREMNLACGILSYKGKVPFPCTPNNTWMEIWTEWHIGHK
jgi:hypothetical protein